MSGKTILRAIALLSTLLAVTSLASAQYTKEQQEFLKPELRTTQPKKEAKPFGKGFVISTLAYAGGVTADLLTTIRNNDYRERNSLFRNGEGRLSVGRALAFSGAVYGVTVALQKRFPKAMNVLRYVFGGAHGIVALGNLRN